MSAPTPSLASVLRVFHQFADGLLVPNQTQAQATELIAQIFAQNPLVEKWSNVVIEELQLPESAPKALLSQFVAALPSLQTSLLLQQFVLALKAANCSESTIKNYRSDINQFLEFTPHTSLDELLTKPKFQAFVRYEREKSLKDSSITRKLKSIAQYGQWAEEHGLATGSRPWLKDISLEKVMVSESLNEATPQAAAALNAENQPQPRRFTLKLPSFSLPVWGKRNQPSPDLQASVNQPHENNWHERIREEVARQNKKNLLAYFSLALLLLFFAGLGAFGYQQLKTNALPSFAFPSSVVRPNRVLSFQGRLTDTSQNPIVNSTNMTFRLYNALTSGTLLWNSGTCSVDPDQDGIFSTGLGSDCGTEIPSNVFSENANVWLEVQVASETLTPRQPIQTVAYAINSETVQGFPITATESATRNSILVMNEWGEVILGESSPKIKSSTGTLSLEGRAILLQTVLGSNGDITLSPDGTGGVIITSPTYLENAVMTGYLSAPGATFSATYAGGTPLVLRGGPSGTANIQEWQNSAGTALSVVDEAGYLGIGVTNPTQTLDLFGSALITGDADNDTSLTINGFGATGDLIRLAESGDAGVITAGYSGLAGARAIINGGVSGGNSSLSLYNPSAALTTLISSGGDSYFNGGNLGIGTTTPGARLDVVGNIFAPIATFSANYAGGKALIAKGGPAGTANIFSIQNASSADLAFFNSAGDLTLNAQNDLRLADSDSTNYIALQAPAIVGSNVTYTLPGTLTNGYILQTDGSGVMTWADPAALTGASTYWNQANGALFAKNSTVDFLVGGQSTASAKFKVLNINTGTPVASVSANSGNIATYLTGDGTLATTNRNNLTIGNSSTYDTTGNILLNPNGTGNVGIGTALPSVKLHVNSNTNTFGRISSSNAGGNTGLQFVNTGDGNEDWTVGRHHQGYFYISNDTDVSAEAFVIGTTGNVGIGTISPLTKLDVEGGASLSGTLAFRGTTDPKIDILNGENFGIRTSPGGDAGLSERLTVLNNGNVGIGDTTPAALFTVGNGDLLQINSSGNLTTSGTINTSAGYYYGGTGSPMNVQLIRSMPTVVDDFIEIGNFTLTNGAHNYRISLTVNDSSFSVAKTYLIPASYNGTSGTWKTVTPISDTGAYSGNNFALDLNVTNTVATLRIRRTLGATAGTALIRIESVGSTSDVFTATSASGSTTAPTVLYGGLYQNATTGLVGIGTTSPTSNLHVYATAADAVFNLESSDLSDPYIQFRTNNANRFRIQNLDNDLRFLSAGTTERVRIDSNGNVGINTSAPGAKLDVNGNLFAPIATFSANYAGGKALIAKGGPSGTANIFSVQNSSSSDLAFFNSAGDLTLNGQNDLRLADADSTNYVALQSPAVVGSNITYTLPGTVTNGYVLQTDGSGVMTWADPAVLAGASTYWNQANGSIFAKNSTVDLLVGGQSTASAKFAVLNVNTGTPVASVSANSGNIATYLTGDGTLATTNKQSLTIGNSSTYNTTGNVLINPNGTGNVGIGTTSPTSKLQVSGGSINLDVNQALQWGGNSNNSLAWDSAAVRINVGGALRARFDASATTLGVDSIGASRLNVSGNTSIGAGYIASAAPTNGLIVEGNVGIGTTAPTSSVKLDIVGGNGILQSNNETDATLKTSRIGVRHYTNAEEPFYWALANANTSANDLYLGGGTGVGNAATSIRFITAANSTTTTGTEAMRIDSSGNIGINDTTPDAKLNIQATTEQLRLDYDDSNYASFTVSSGGDLTLNPTGGNVIIPSSDFLNAGGATVADYNYFASSVAGNSIIDGAGDLYLQDELEVDGAVKFDNASLTFSTFTNNGGILYTNGSGVLAQTGVGNSGECLTSIGGGAPVWSSCSASSGNLWRLSSGALSPVNDTADVLFGGVSTASAKFRFLNINTGTPVASVSANSGNIATYITGDGTLATTNRNNLTIGNSSAYNTTGNVLINPNGTGSVGIGTTLPTAGLKLHIVDATGGNVRAESTGVDSSASYQLANDVQQWQMGVRGAVSDSFIIRDSSGAADRLTITTSGNVGIGTTTPGAKLDINGNLFAPIATFSANYAAGVPLAVRGQASQTGDLTQWQNNSGTVLAGMSANPGMYIGTTSMPSGISRLYLGETVTSPAAGYLQQNIRITTDAPAYTGSTNLRLQAARTGSALATEQTAGVIEAWLNSTNTQNWTSSGNVNQLGLTAVEARTEIRSGAAGTVSWINSLVADADFNSNSTATLTNYAGLKVFQPANAGSLAGFTNNYGIFVSDFNAGTNDFALLTNAGNVVFNEGGDANTDLRIEGDTDANLFFSDASTNRIGIGTTTPGAKLDINGDLYSPTATFSANYAAGVPLTVKGGPSGTGNITNWQNSAGTSLLSVNSDGNLTTNARDFSFIRNGVTKWTFGSSANYFYGDAFLIDGGSIPIFDFTSTETVFNQSGANNKDLRIEGDTNANLLFTQASTDRVGINDTTPDAKLNILATTEQLRLDYDDSNFASFFTQADGELQISTTGTDPDITLNPGTSGSLIFADLNCTGNTNGGALTADASGVISCSDDETGTGGTSYWRQANGAISPTNDTNDVLIGSAATASAKFRFLNVNTGTPVASISANSGNNASYITGDGYLGTTNRQTLTIGNATGFDTTGNTIINPNGNGRVGIGVNVPQYTLDVLGGYVQSRVTTNTATGFLIDNLNSPLWGVQAAVGGRFEIYDFGLGASRLAISTTGNVGIGNVAPGSKLDVAGDLFAPIATFSANYAGGKALIAKGGPSGTANIFSVQNSSSTDLAFFNSAGDLTLNAQNDLRLADSDSTNYIALQSPAVVGSNLTYTLPGTVTAGYIMQTDGSGVMSWVNPESATGYWRLANGALSPTNNTTDLLVGSNATTSAKFAVLNVNTGTPVASISANSGNIATYITGDGSLSTTNRQSLVLGNSTSYNTTGDVLINPNGIGNVGIGTLTPSATFEVNTSGNSTAYFRRGTAGRWRLGTEGAGGYNFITSETYDGGGYKPFLLETRSGGSLYIDTSGNVGIGSGTTAPGAKLNVIGDIFAPTATFSANYAGGKALIAKGGPSGTANIFSVQNSSSSDLAFFNSAGDLTLNLQNDLRFADADSSNYVALQSPAVVGSNLTYTLPGTVTNGYVLQTNGTGTLTWVDPTTLASGVTNYWRQTNGALSPINDTNDLLIGGVSTASAKFAFININTGSPTASIAGNLAITAPTGANPTTSVDVLNGGSLNVRTSPGGNAGLLSRLFVANNGNVGIGTDTPTSRLQIAGASSTISNSSGDITINAASNQVSLSGDSLANLLNIDASGQIKPGSFGANPTAIGSGSIIYRSDNGYLHYYNGSAWLALYPSLWQVNLNAYSPVDVYGNVADVLVGGTTTSSARIALNATTGYLSAQRFVDKANSDYYLDPAATDIALSIVGKAGIGTNTPAHQLHVQSTVTGKALAVFNETGNNSILVASSSGSRVFEIENEGNIIAGNPTKQDINVKVYGDLFSADDTNLEAAATGIVGSYLYDTATDRDSGYWRKSAVSKTLSWYTESRDDALGIPCSLTSSDRCGTEHFPAKANLVLSTTSLYVFDALSNTLWMKFDFGSGNAIGAVSAENSPTAVTAIDGRVFVSTRGSSGGIYEINFKTDTMSLYTTTDRSESAQTISGRNGGSNTFSSNSMTAFALTNRSVNDMDVTYANGRAQLAAATNAGINLIDLDYKLDYEYTEQGSNSNVGDTITDDGNTANPAANAFDGIESTIARSDGIDSVMTLTYQFASGKVIQRYGMMHDDADLNEAPSAWTFEGSANGSTWVELDRRTGYDWFDVGNNGNTQYWDITNTTSYPYYRVVVSDVFNAAADNVRIAEIYLKTKSQKSAVRLYGEDLAKNYVTSVSSANNTTTLGKRRITDWRRINVNGEYSTSANDTLPSINITLRKPAAYTQYNVSASSSNTSEPTAWQVLGSNDGLNWTTLDTRTSQTFAASYVPVEYSFSNSTAYKHYRLNITANNTATTTEIGDFQVGTPIITASTSVDDNSFDESNLLYQDNSAAAYQWLASAGANEWVQYDYGTANPKVISTYGLRGYQSAQPTRAISGWRIQGSADCSSWTTLDTQTAQTYASDYALNTYTMANTTAYRCYRLLVDTLNGGTQASLKGLYFFGAEDRLIASSDESDAADNVSRLSDETDFGRWTSLAGDNTGWIEKHFAEGQEATISGILLEGATSVAESMKDFTVFGSNDRSTWTELYNENRSVMSAATDIRTYKFTNNTAYRFYQLGVEATQNSTVTSLDELKLLGGYYNKVAFSDNALVGTNATTGQVDIYNAVFSDTNSRAINFTGNLTADTDFSLTSIPNINSAITPRSLHPALSGTIHETPYALETDGGVLYIGHSNGVDVIKNNPNDDPDANFTAAQISGRINTTRNVSNPFGFDHYWPMDEASSAAQLNNFGTSGWNSYPLEISGPTIAPISTPSGKINRAYSFNGSTQHVSAIRDASFNDIDSNGEFTMGGWVYTDAAGITGAQCIMGDYLYDGANVYGSALCLQDNALLFIGGNGGAGNSIAYYSNASIPTEEWAFVTVKLEDGLLKFYVNGEFRDSTAAIAIMDGSVFFIGQAESTVDFHFTGRLDELFVKHAKISDADIKKIYELGLKNATDPRAQVTNATSVTITDASTTSSTTIGSSTLNLGINSLAGQIVEITGGTGAGQTRLITKNSATTLTVSPAWSSTPDSTSDFEVTPYALPGSVNTAKALRVDGQNVFVGLNDGADGGGVVRLSQKNLAVSDYYHSGAGKTDSTSTSWGSTTGYDNIVGVESTVDNLFIMGQTQIWREKLGESLLEAITRLQQVFSAATVDTHTQDMHGTNVRNTTRQVVRKGWGYLDGGDTSRTVYYGITYDDLPIVLGNLAGIVPGTVGQLAPTSLDQCTLGTPSVDAIGVSSIKKDRFSMAEANTGNACFTWMSLGSYSGSTPEGSFGGGADLAEWYGTDDTTLEAGEIVSIDPSGDIKVMRSGKTQDSTAIGIIATQPAITLGDASGLTPGYNTDPQLAKGAATAVQVALAGRVPVKVTLENGPIKAGDYLTTGTIPGTAAKAIKAGPTIGKALENFDGRSTIVGIADSQLDLSNIASSSAVAIASDSAKPDGTVKITDESQKLLSSGQGVIMAFVNTSYFDPAYASVTTSNTNTQGDGAYAIDSKGNVVGLGSYSFDLVDNAKYLNDLIAEAEMLATDSANASSSAYLAANRENILQAAFGRLQALGTLSLKELNTAQLRVLGGLFSRQTETDQLKTDLITPLTQSDINVQFGNASQAGQLNIRNGQGRTVTQIDDQGNLITLGSLLASDASISGELVAGDITTNTITATSSRLEYLEGKVAQLDSINAQTAQIVNATISGTLFADDIFEFDAKVAAALEQPSLLSKLMPSATPAPTSTTDWSAITPASSSGTLQRNVADLNLTDTDLVLAAEASYIDQYFQVNGNAYFGQSIEIADQALVGTSLQVGSTLTITGTSIAADMSTLTDQTLYFQPTGQGTINLLAGILTISEDGEVIVNGKLTINGDLEVADTLFTDLLQPTDFVNPLQVKLATQSGSVAGATTDVTRSRFEIIDELGTPVATISSQGRASFASGLGIGSQDLTASDSANITTNQTSGKAQLSAGSTELTINAPAITNNSLIYITPTSSTGNQVLYIKAQQVDDSTTPELESKFVVGLDQAIQNDVLFNWWIIN